MIGVDWGTTSLRAYLLGEDGHVIERARADRGIMRISPGGFPAALMDSVGSWIAAGERRVLLSGMVGSRQGWVEAPYLPCPAGPREIAAGLIRIPHETLDILLAPGLRDTDAGGAPEVMRGEETQILGVVGHVQPDALVCLPGSHSKWVRLRGHAIASFETYLSGEAFAAIRNGTILGRMMQTDAHDEAAFLRGVARAQGGGHLLHHLFGVRALALAGELAEPSSAAYLSGLLIGHEVGAALAGAARVHLVAEEHLAALYALALGAFGAEGVILPPDAAAAGLHAIGRSAAWVR